jgi:hypothetical protein
VTDSRAAFDFVSGYKPYHVPDSILAESPLPIERLRREGKILSDRQWLLRIIVLESVAGVPGMVGGTLRHLRSLRLLVRIHLSVSCIKRTRLMNREEMEDGSIRYWKKQRMRGCTSCKFLLVDRIINEGADGQDILNGRATNSLDTSASPGRPGSHVQPLLLHVPDLLKDGTSICWRSRGGGM